MTALRLPRNTTHQAEGVLYGRLARLLHRWSGIVIVGFVLVHVVVQALRHVPAFAPVIAAAPWLEPLQKQHWIHALLFFSIVYHTLHGLRLFVGELGIEVEYRAAFWVTLGCAALAGTREVLRYAG